VRLALAYAAGGALWIVVSTTVIQTDIADPLTRWMVTIAKGLAFVAVTSVVLLALLRRRAGALTRAVAAQERLVSVAEQAFNPIILTDTQGTIEYVNAAFERLTGYAREEVIGQNPRILGSGVQSDAFYRDMWAALAAGQAWRGSFVNRRKDGTLYTADEIISPLRDATGRVTHYAARQHDVTTEREAEAREVRRARERSLVGEALGRLSTQVAPEEIAQAICDHVVRLSDVALAVLLTFEHDGDAATLGATSADGRVLKHHRVPAQRSQELWSRALAGPWVEMWNQPPGHPYHAVITELGVRAHAYAPIQIGSAVVGVLAVGSADPGAIEVLTAHLPALVEFAAIGGALLAPSLAAWATASGAQEVIRALIAERAFRPVFQPIVELARGDVVGYEALTRFNDGAPPDAMFAAAEAAGLGLELEAATLGEALAAAGSLPLGPWLELNASPSFVLAGEPLAGLLGAVRRPLVLELTEHEAVTDYATLRGAIGRLGPEVRFAVDDAGAGFASLRHILELRPHIVKLDRALVAGIDADPTRQALVAGMQHFATTTGCTLLAEGVETAAEAAMVASLGVHLAQGYWFARPEPAAEVAGLGSRLPVPSTDPDVQPGPRAVADRIRVSTNDGGLG